LGDNFVNRTVIDMAGFVEKLSQNALTVPQNPPLQIPNYQFSISKKKVKSL